MRILLQNVFYVFNMNVIKMNVFISLFLAIVIMLAKLTGLRKFFTLSISRTAPFYIPLKKHISFFGHPE